MYVARKIVAHSNNHFALETQQCILCCCCCCCCCWVTCHC